MNQTDINRVAIVSGSMGSGHDQVANELSRRLAARGIPSVIVDILRCMPPALGNLIRYGYHSTATFAPWLLDISFNSTQRQSSRSSRLVKYASGSNLRELIGRSRVAVSVHPFATQTLGALKASGSYAGATVSYITDPAPHLMWINRHIDYNLSATEYTARAAAEIYNISIQCGGPLVAARFHDKISEHERVRLRKELGVPDGMVLALLVSGAKGLGKAGKAAVAARQAGFWPVVVCGHNDRLRRKVEHLNMLALGWRSDIHRLMAAADISIHNAGGLTFTEAMVVGLPAISFLPVAGHGVANARFMETHGMAPWARTVADLKHHGCLLARADRHPIPQVADTAADFIANLCTRGSRILSQVP